MISFWFEEWKNVAEYSLFFNVFLKGPANAVSQENGALRTEKKEIQFSLYFRSYDCIHTKFWGIYKKVIRISKLI